MAEHNGGVTEGPVWKREGAYAVCSCGWRELHDTPKDAHMAIDQHLREHGAA